MQLSKTTALIAVASLAVIAVAAFVLRQQLDAPFEGQELLVSRPQQQRLEVAPIPEPVAKKREPLPALGDGPATQSPMPSAEGSANASTPVPASAPSPVPASVPTPAPQPTGSSASAISPVPVVTKTATPAASVSAPAALPSDAPDRFAAPVSGSLARITALRAELEETRVMASIEQERARLRAAATPVLVSPPTPALQLPPMELPRRTGAPANSATSSAPRVLSVHGVDGSMSATVRTGKGLRSVRVGDQLDGGSVVSISRDGVSLRLGSRITHVPFGE